MNKILPIILLFSCLSAFSQDTLPPNTHTYISLKIYKEMGETLMQEDKVRIRDNDTLVLVSADFLKRFNDGKVQTEYEPKDSTFLKVYKQVVFGTHLENPTKATIKIWKDDVRILFDSTVPQEHKQELLEFANKISSGIDSLNIVEASNRMDANYFVFYRSSEDEFDHEPGIRKDVGGFYLHWNEKQQLYRGVIKINAYEIGPRTQKAHLKYHFFRSLGNFYAAPDLPCESYYSDCPVVRTFTRLDYEILKYHYSYGMCKGINLENFERIHRDNQKTLAEKPHARLYLLHEE